MLLRQGVIKGDLEEVKKHAEQDPLLPNELDSGLNCFHYASHYNNVAVLRFLFELVDGNKVFSAVSKRGYTPMHSAALAGSLECLECLLERFSKYCNVQNEWKETALHLAAQSGFKKGFDLLLKYGASTDILDKWGRSPGDVAKESFLGRQEAIRKPLTIQAKTNLSKMMEFPLDDTRFVQLCAESSDLEGCDYFGLTALHKLASWDKPNCMHLLFSRVSDPARFVNAVDAEGNTAAHLCASEMCLKILVFIQKFSLPIFKA